LDTPRTPQTVTDQAEEGFENSFTEKVSQQENYEHMGEAESFQGKPPPVEMTSGNPFRSLWKVSSSFWITLSYFILWTLSAWMMKSTSVKREVADTGEEHRDELTEIKDSFTGSNKGKMDYYSSSSYSSQGRNGLFLLLLLLLFAREEFDLGRLKDSQESPRGHWTGLPFEPGADIGDTLELNHSVDGDIPYQRGGQPEEHTTGETGIMDWRSEDTRSSDVHVLKYDYFKEVGMFGLRSRFLLLLIMQATATTRTSNRVLVLEFGSFRFKVF
jgi:hypothetical protein